MERAKLNFSDVQFFSSGSTLLDLVIGGGWALGRIFNIVGDKSSGKTLLAIEAFANFKRAFPTGKMRYAESESAFDDSYAEMLGFPKEVERTEEPLRTVENFRDDLEKFLKKGGPGLYILDSLDALSDDAELKLFTEKSEKGSFGVGKPKEMSKLFRLLTQEASNNDCSVGIISQIRDRIGVTFGETKTRSGGHALDFYASQIVWLSEIGKLTRTSKGVERAVGVQILAKCKKCKVGFPFREAEMNITFGYGVDNEMSIINWLQAAQALTKEEATEMRKKLAKARGDSNIKLLDELEAALKQDVTTMWNEIEKGLAPSVRKYRE